MKRNIAAATIVFLLFLLAGIGFVRFGWQGLLPGPLGTREVARENQRRPWLNMTAEPTPKNEVIDGLRLKTETDGRIGVEIPNFVATLPDGSPATVCRIYDLVELTFRAEGVAEGGERPTLRASTHCSNQTDSPVLTTVWIPIGEFIKQPPGNVGWQHPQMELEVQFKHMLSDFWPEEWVLENVRFLNSQEQGLALSLDATELGRRKGANLIFNWTTFAKEGPAQRLPTSNQ